MSTIPTQLGAYSIDRELGRGGMGVVYLGRDRRLGRQVAIKTLPEALASNPDRLARFEREAKTLASVNHPGIATIHALEDGEDGSKFLVLEYIEGESLAERFAQSSLSMRDALKVGRQIAEALAAAHKRGVVHRDLKPSNIMLLSDGGVKILDFGLAKASAVEGDDQTQVQTMSVHVTLPGGVMGTPGYMSPEQARGLPVDTRSDIFSFGCVLYECLSNASAFAGDTPSDVMAQVLTNEPDWSALPQGLSTKVLELLIRCLTKELDARLADASAAAQILDDALSGSRTPASARVSLETPPSNLPASVTSFIGREHEIEELKGIFERSRLVTLTGSGGCGKTRLGMRLAHDLLSSYADGVWHVALASLTAAGLTQALMSALGLKDEKGKSPSETLVDHLRDKHALIVLDGCEHLLGECASLVETLLRSCPSLRVLITSRQSLGIPGETTYRVPSLSTPKDIASTPVDALLEYEAVRLFADRAAAASPRFRMTDDVARIVAEIVQKIDGIPLAIELAAARVRAMSISQIARRLDNSFRLLRGGAQSGLERHQTLQATIDWSYSMLTEEEQTLFGRLAVFSGGWTLEAAERVCAADPIDEFDVLDLLSLLVEKSLVIYEESADRERYRLLETMRQYALSKLEATDEAAPLRDRHLDYFVELAEEAEPDLRGSVECLERLSAERENLLAAHEWAGQAELGGNRGLRLVAAMWRLFDIRGQFALGFSLVSDALHRPGAEAPTVERSKALYAAGVMTLWRGDYETCERLLNEGIELSRSIDDFAGIANMHNGRGITCMFRAELDGAQREFNASLEAARKAGDDTILATALGNAGELALERGDRETAQTLLEEAVTIGRRIRSLSATSLPDQLRTVAVLALRSGDVATAKRHLAECIGLVKEFNSKSYGAQALECVAALALADAEQDTGAPRLGAAIFCSAQTLRKQIGAPVMPHEQEEHGRLAESLKDSLGDAAFNEVELEGARISFNSACQQALDWLSASS